MKDYDFYEGGERTSVVDQFRKSNSLFKSAQAVRNHEMVRL